MAIEDAGQVRGVEAGDVLRHVHPVEGMVHAEKERDLAEEAVHVDEGDRRRRFQAGHAVGEVHGDRRRPDAALAAEDIDDLAFPLGPACRETGGRLPCVADLREGRAHIGLVDGLGKKLLHAQPQGLDEDIGTHVFRGQEEFPRPACVLRPLQIFEVLGGILSHLQDQDVRGQRVVASPDQEALHRGRSRPRI